MNKFVSKIVSLIAALSMIAPVGFAPATALAATTIFSDGFGTSELPSSITGWTESGGSTTGSASGPDATRNGVSSNKFARLDDDNSYMYRTIDATGYENLTLKYYYKGDANAGSSDDLHVQFCDGSSCSSFADLSGGVHGLDNCVDIQPGPGVNLLCSWSSEQSRTLPAAADNGLFRIRFLNDSDDGDEHARIDDISIEGDPIAPIEYTLTVSKAGTGTGYVQSDLTSDIDCGSDCSDPFTSGSVVELFQTADPGSVFAGWSGACTGTGFTYSEFHDVLGVDRKSIAAWLWMKSEEVVEARAVRRPARRAPCP